jgi:hypothetical protein
MWEPSTGTSHRLPKLVSRKQLDNRVTNNRNSTGIVTSRFYIWSALTHNRNIRRRRFSQLDTSDRLTRTFQQCSQHARAARSVSRNTYRSQSAKTSLMKPGSWSSWFALKSSPTGSCRWLRCGLQNVPRDHADCAAGMYVLTGLRYLADWSVFYVYFRCVLRRTKYRNGS